MIDFSGEINEEGQEEGDGRGSVKGCLIAREWEYDINGKIEGDIRRKRKMLHMLHMVKMRKRGRVTESKLRFFVIATEIEGEPRMNTR